MNSFKDNLDKIKKGDRRIFAKTLTKMNDLNAADLDILVNTFKKQSKVPLILGLVGSPGAGKSTFINQFLDYGKLAKNKKKIGMLLIDPSSPIHGGSLLGDRVRLLDHFLNPEIFIRSISNLGNVNGLNPHLDKYLMLFSLFPFDVVIIESVGGGQASTDLKSYVDKLILIFDPHAGDEIQFLKSGVLDIADNVIISKADLCNVEAVLHSLRDSISSTSKIYSANLTNKSDLNSYFESELVNIVSQPSRKLIAQLLKSITHEKVDKILQEYFSNEFNKKEIGNFSIQEFQKDFKKYFLQNY